MCSAQLCGTIAEFVTHEVLLKFQDKASRMTTHLLFFYPQKKHVINYSVKCVLGVDEIYIENI